MAILSFAMLIVFVIIANISTSVSGAELDSASDNDVEDELDRNTIYQSSATVLALALFGSVLAFRFGGQQRTEGIRRSGAILMFIGAFLIAIMCVLLMIYACCSLSIEREIMFMSLLSIFAAVLMFLVGLLFFISTYLEGSTGPT